MSSGKGVDCMTATVRIPARSKYNARRTEYNGIVYDSAAEARYAASLDLRVKVGDIKEWFRQIRYPLMVNGTKICDMVIDFKIHHANRGALEVEFVEVKGCETDTYRLKLKLLKALYPNLRLTVIKAGTAAAWHKTKGRSRRADFK